MQSRNPFDKKNEIYGSKTLHREIGYYISRLEQYSNALQFFDHAIKETPEDRRALIGRSRARAKVAQYEGALEDINHALSVEPDDLGVLGDKALNTYLCCEFEDGLIQNIRLLPKRQKPDVFSLGVMNCYEAIENCVGERTGRPLRDHFKIIRKLAWKRNYAAQKPFEPTPKGKTKKKRQPKFLQKLYRPEESREPVQPKKLKIKKSPLALDIKDSLHSIPSDHERIPPYTQPFPFKPLQDYTSNIENYMAEKYLDKMYLDKIFLKQIPNEPGAYCPNKKGAAKLKQIAKNCFKTVSYKQELLRTRRPFYYIKYQEARVSGALKERQLIELELQQQVTKKEADSILQKMMDAYEAKDLRECLVYTEKLRRYCDSKSKKTLPDKSYYMNAISETVCKAFYDVHRVNPCQSFYEQSKRIYAIFGLPLSREPSSDSVIAQFKNVFLDYKKRIHDFEMRLENAVLPEEVCWFYHELARYHLDQKRYDLSRLYARKCIQEASTIQNDMWIFNSTMLLCKSDLQQHNKSDAKNDLQQALKCAIKLKDEQKIAYMKLCMEVVESVQFDDLFGLKELEKREQKIVQMMSGTKMKDEVAHLFRQMAAMPASRRMTVIPGVIVPTKETKQSKSRAMSIMPTKREEGSIKDLKRVRSDKELMNIIELHL